MIVNRKIYSFLDFLVNKKSHIYICGQGLVRFGLSVHEILMLVNDLKKVVMLVYLISMCYV